MQRKLTKLLVVVSVISVAMYAADSEVEIWKFNPAKSSPSNLKSRTEVIEDISDGRMKVTRTELREDGINRTFSFTFKYDGKEYPVTGGTFGTIAQKRLDANTTTFEVKMTGTGYHASGTFTISKDGKTRTQVDKGIGQNGKPFELIRIYDKQ